jgi:hypothetical protein
MNTTIISPSLLGAVTCVGLFVTLVSLCRFIVARRDDARRRRDEAAARQSNYRDDTGKGGSL